MKSSEKQNNYLLGDETSIKQNQYYKARQLFAYQNSQGEKGNCLKTDILGANSANRLNTSTKLGTKASIVKSSSKMAYE